MLSHPRAEEGALLGEGLGTMVQLQQNLLPAFSMALDWAAHQNKLHSSTCSSGLGSWNAFVHEPFQGIMTPGWLGDCCACLALFSPSLGQSAATPHLVALAPPLLGGRFFFVPLAQGSVLTPEGLAEVMGQSL